MNSYNLDNIVIYIYIYNLRCRYSSSLLKFLIISKRIPACMYVDQFLHEEIIVILLFLIRLQVYEMCAK